MVEPEQGVARFHAGLFQVGRGRVALDDEFDVGDAGAEPFGQRVQRFVDQSAETIAFHRRGLRRRTGLGGYPDLHQGPEAGPVERVGGNAEL